MLLNKIQGNKLNFKWLHRFHLIEKFLPDFKSFGKPHNNFAIIFVYVNFLNDATKGKNSHRLRQMIENTQNYA